MDKRTKTALLASIQHWKENLEAAEKGIPPNINSRSCALCNEFTFHIPPDDAICAGCPVYEKTGRIRCQGTPYHEVVLQTKLPTRNWAKIRLHTKLELDFLTSLLPTKKA